MAAELILVTEEMRDAGYDILRKTDDIGLNAIGAGWFLPSDDDRWRFFLVTPLIDSRGPAWVYERLIKALRVLHFPKGITPLQVHLVSPREERFYDLSRRLAVPEMGERNLFHCSDGSVNRHGMAAIVVYRMREMDQRAAETARRFDARVGELLAA